jgi:MFS family permease
VSHPRRAPALAVTALCLVQFTDVLGVTVVVTALPAMIAGLHASPSSSTLVATGYSMFFGGLLMLGARLGDRFGHRRTILVNLGVLAVGGVVAATASSVAALTAGRCLRGAAAAASVPSALRLLTTVTGQGPARQRAIAAWSAAGAAAGASGFVIGGIVTDLASWRFVFWAYLPLAAALAAAIAISVPAGADNRLATSLNLAGSAVFTAAVMAFVVGTTVITEPAGRLAGGLLLGASVVLAAGFGRRHRPGHRRQRALAGQRVGCHQHRGSAGHRARDRRAAADRVVHQRAAGPRPPAARPGLGGRRGGGCGRGRPVRGHQGRPSRYDTASAVASGSRRRSFTSVSGSAGV